MRFALELLRPGALPDDQGAIANGLVPELQSRGVFRTAYEGGTLRGLFKLERPADRHAQHAEKERPGRHRMLRL